MKYIYAIQAFFYSFFYYIREFILTSTFMAGIAYKNNRFMLESSVDFFEKELDKVFDE